MDLQMIYSSKNHAILNQWYINLYLIIIGAVYKTMIWILAKLEVIIIIRIKLNKKYFKLKLIIFK
jgi:hypothetical protein